MPVELASRYCSQRQQRHRRSWIIWSVAFTTQLVQIYDAQFTERTCIAIPDNVPPYLLARSHPEREWDEDDGWPGGLNRRVMPETPKHKDLWPLDVWDILGWLIGVVTVFIAAGTPGENRACGSPGWMEAQCKVTHVLTRFINHLRDIFRYLLSLVP